MGRLNHAIVNAVMGRASVSHILRSPHRYSYVSTCMSELEMNRPCVANKNHFIVALEI